MQFLCAGLLETLAPGRCLTEVRSRCGAARIFGLGHHILWQGQWKPSCFGGLSRLFVTGAGGRNMILG